MNLKIFNQELYLNCDLNKCYRCGSAMTKDNKFSLYYELVDPTTKTHKLKTTTICRGCMEKLNAYLYNKEFVGL